MPSDSSVYNLYNHPSTELYGPAQLNALALQRQQLQGGALSLQDQQRALADAQATRAAQLKYYGNLAAPPANALAPAPSPPAAAPFADPNAPPPFSPGGGYDPSTISANPGASGAPVPGSAPAPTPAPPSPPVPPPHPRVPTVAELVTQYQMPPASAQAMVDQLQKSAETAAEIGSKRATADKANQDVTDAVTQQVSDMANGLIKNAVPGRPIAPDLLAWHLQSIASTVSPSQVPRVQQIGAHLAQLGPDDQISFLKTLTSTPKTIEANAAVVTAQGTAAEREAAGRKSDQETAQAKLSQASQLLASAPNAQAYGAVLSRLDPQTAALGNFPAASAWTPATPNAVRQIGLTSEQGTTTAQTAIRDANTKANELTARNQEQQNIGISAGRLGVERYSAGLGPDGKPLAGSNLTGEAYLATLPLPLQLQVKAISDGREIMPSGRAAVSGQGRVLAQAVTQYSPGFSTQLGQLRSAFTSGAQGSNIGNLNTAVIHLDQYHEVMKAMNNGTFVPGNQLYNWAASKFGSAKVTNPTFVRQSLAGEAASALKGNATDPEIAGVMKALDPNASPASQEGTSLEALKVLGAKLNTYDERYQQVAPGDPWTPVLPSARAVFARYGIQPLARVGAAPAPGAPQPGAPGAASTPRAVHPAVAQAQADIDRYLPR